MSFAILGMICLVVGLGLGYAIGWNAAKHPGKLEDQMRSWWAKLRHKEPPA